VIGANRVNQNQHDQLTVGGRRGKVSTQQGGGNESVKHGEI
jgi:hypothetical protein